jgi:hypothetical protein
MVPIDRETRTILHLHSYRNAATDARKKAAKRRFPGNGWPADCRECRAFFATFVFSRTFYPVHAFFAGKTPTGNESHHGRINSASGPAMHRSLTEEKFPSAACSSANFVESFMLGRSLIVLAACIGLALVGRAEPIGRVPNGPEALPRGPVHEAYAQPADSQARPAPVIQRQPPTQIEEQPPDQKPPGAVVWIPGYWQWDEDRSDFIWVSGFWRVPPPGRQWLPGSYRQVEGGYQWVPGLWSADNQEAPRVQPAPPASVEAGPSQPAPSADSVYVPGTWVYRDTRYLWRPGFFMEYRPDYTWVPAHYIWTPAGYVFVEGYWDYPLAQRGLLFAPVAFSGTGYLQPDFSYTPNYVVSAAFLPTALFVRPAYGHYYFGDYYGPVASRAGYTPWVDYRPARGFPDPLFAQTRLRLGGASWERQIRTLYVERTEGAVVRPPSTLVQQNAQPRSLAVVSPLSQVSAQGIALTSVSGSERLRYEQSGRQIRERAVLRSANVQRVQTPAAPATAIRHDNPIAPAHGKPPSVTHAAASEPRPTPHHHIGARHSEPASRPAHGRPHKP